MKSSIVIFAGSTAAAPVGEVAAGAAAHS